MEETLDGSPDILVQEVLFKLVPPETNRTPITLNVINNTALMLNAVVKGPI